MYPIIFFTLAIIAASIHLFISKKPKTAKRIVGLFLTYLVFFNIGIESLFAAMGHVFMANQLAEQIGWPIGSPFQFEVGMANFAVGVAGVLTLFYDDDFRLATVIVSSVFIFGAAYGRFVQIAKGDTAPFNTGVFLYAGDIIIPAIILILMLAYYFILRKNKK